MAVRADVQRPRGARALRGEDVDLLPDDAAAAAVFLHDGGVVEACVQREEALEHGRGELVLAVPARRGEDGGGDRVEGRREAARGLVDVDADAQHDVAQTVVLHAHGRLRQDAARLFAAYKDVVDPLDARLPAADAADRVADGDGGRRRDADRLRRRVADGAQQKAHVQAAPTRGIEGARQPSPARRLLLRDEDEPLRLPRLRARADEVVGRGRGRKHLHAHGRARGQILADALRGELVAALRQPIAAVFDRLHGIPRLPQRLRRLPDRVARDAQPRGDFLPGEKSSPSLFQKRKQRVLDHARSLPPCTISFPAIIPDARPICQPNLGKRFTVCPLLPLLRSVLRRVCLT